MLKALTAASLLLLSLSAGAAPDKGTTLTTAAINVPESEFTSVFLVCDAINVSPTPLPVTIEIVDYNATATVSTSATLEPGKGTYVYNQQSSGYCRVSFVGPATAVRASLCNYMYASGGCISIVEAR